MTTLGKRFSPKPRFTSTVGSERSSAAFSIGSSLSAASTSSPLTWRFANASTRSRRLAACSGVWAMRHISECLRNSASRPCTIGPNNGLAMSGTMIATRLDCLVRKDAATALGW